MRAHRSLTLLLAAALLAAALARPARPAGTPLGIVELAIEASQDSIVLPTGPGSTLVVTPCRACRPISLVADARTAYLIGDQAVTLAELRRWLGTRRGVAIAVFYARGTTTLTRVVVPAH